MWTAENAIAGNSEALQALRELITYPLLYPRESKILGLKWPRGLLLYGPPGMGKGFVKRSDATDPPFVCIIPRETRVHHL